MRMTTLLKKLLGIQHVVVTGFDIEDGALVIDGDVGSAAATREVFEAGYSRTCRDPSRNPTLRGPDDLTGRSRPWLSQTRTIDPGSRDDHADTGRHLAPGATHLPGAVPVTAEIA